MGAIAKGLMATGYKSYTTGQKLIDKLVNYANQPLPQYSDQAALQYLSDMEKAGYDIGKGWITGKDPMAAKAEGLINEILSGSYAKQPGVKTMFGEAIEYPILSLLNDVTLPQIRASAGKGGTYFSTMRGQNEIDATQNATSQIGAAESGYILNMITDAMNKAMALPALKSQFATTAGQGLRGAWKAEQPEYGGANVPMILDVIKANEPYGVAGMGAAQNLAAQREAINAQQQQAMMSGISSGFGSTMGAAGTVGGAAAGKGGCCFIMLENDDLTSDVRFARDKLFPPESFIAKGYRSMANWLVPMMRRNKFVKKLVKLTMTKPIAQFAYYSNRNDGKFNPNDLTGLLYAPPTMFWCIVWDVIARVKRCFQ